MCDCSGNKTSVHSNPSYSTLQNYNIKAPGYIQLPTPQIQIITSFGYSGNYDLLHGVLPSGQNYFNLCNAYQGSCSSDGTAICKNTGIGLDQSACGLIDPLYGHPPGKLSSQCCAEQESSQGTCAPALACTNIDTNSPVGHQMGQCTAKQ